MSKTWIKYPFRENLNQLQIFFFLFFQHIKRNRDFQGKISSLWPTAFPFLPPRPPKLGKVLMITVSAALFAHLPFTHFIAGWATPEAQVCDLWPDSRLLWLDSVNLNDKPPVAAQHSKKITYEAKADTIRRSHHCNDISDQNLSLLVSCHLLLSSFNIVRLYCRPCLVGGAA